MWHPDAYLKRLAAGTKPEFGFDADSEADWRDWHNNLRAAFVADLGGFPAQAAPLEARMLEAVDCGDYVRERVEFTTYAGMRMPAYVLVPAAAGSRGAGKLPAVVACHGHGYGSRELVGLSPTGEDIRDRPTYQKFFAIELAQRGFLVVVPEILGFGDRRTEEEFNNQTYSSCHSVSTYLLQFGLTMAGHRVYETKRAVDYIVSRTDTDPNRIGCMGISGGGLVTAFTAALDDRIRASVVSGYINSFEASILAMHHCVDNYVPGLSKHAEMADIAALIAPRALFVEAGDADPIFPIAASKEAYAALERVYRLLKREDRLAADFFSGGHEIHGALCYEWLQRQLEL